MLYQYAYPVHRANDLVGVLTDAIVPIVGDAQFSSSPLCGRTTTEVAFNPYTEAEVASRVEIDSTAGVDGYARITPSICRWHPTPHKQ